MQTVLSPAEHDVFAECPYLSGIIVALERRWNIALALSQQTVGVPRPHVRAVLMWIGKTFDARLREICRRHDVHMVGRDALHECAGCPLLVWWMEVTKDGVDGTSMPESPSCSGGEEEEENEEEVGVVKECDFAVDVCAFVPFVIAACAVVMMMLW